MRIALVWLALVLAGGVASAESIAQIVVQDNTKTEADTVALIAGIEVGDEWHADRVDEIKARLESSGLFRAITVFWDAHPEGGARVYLKVRDKHSWIVAPAFYNQPTNIGGGIGFGENNLFGRNQKLLLYGQIATGDTFFIGAWVIPNINGTRFYAQFDTYLRSARNIEYASPAKYLDNPVAVRESRIHYLNAGIRLGIEIFRGFKLDTRLRGASVSYQDIKLLADATPENSGVGEGEQTPPPGSEGADISNEWTLSLDRRANYLGVQTGYRYSASFETSTPSLGSDFRYFLTGVSLFRGRQVLDRHNVVARASIGYGQRLPFQQEYLTGGTSMRGWLNNQFRGNLKVLANLEYSFPLFTIQGLSIRGLGFLDTSYTTFTKTSDNLDTRNYLPDAQARGFAPFKNSIGLGTRFNLRQIVLPLLGLDFGYGLESRDLQIYLAIGLTD